MLPDKIYGKNNILQYGNIKKYRRDVFFGVLLLAFALFSCWITAPLFEPIAWAAIVSFILSPLKKNLARWDLLRRYPDVLSGLTVLIMLVGLIIPLVFFVNAIAQETMGLYANVAVLASEIRGGVFPDITQYIPSRILEYLTPVLQDSSRVNAAVARFIGFVAPYLGKISTYILQWTGKAFIEMLLVLFFAFFFIRDGEKILRALQSLMPLSTQENAQFFDQANRLMRSILCGIILTTLIQAVLGGVGWWYVGLPRAYLAGIVMFAAGLFPAGTAVVWGPAGLYLLAVGEIAGGALLIAWGAVVVGSVDNVLRPLLMNVESVPTLGILIGLLGGAFVFGVLGIFLGPLTVSLFLMLLDMYRKKQGAPYPGGRVSLISRGRSPGWTRRNGLESPDSGKKNESPF